MSATSTALSWQERWQAILEHIHVVPDAAAEEALLAQLSSGHGRAVSIAFVNAHALNLAARNPSFCADLLAADILLRDGSGMGLLYRRWGRPGGLNMNGTDFIPKLLERFAGRRVALWGTAEPFLGLAADTVRTRFAPTSLDLQNGFLSAHQYAEMAVATQPELIVLGMGMPKQEAVATRLRAQQGAAVIACGGAILDFLGGRFPRAPQWMRRLGIEWLFRLAREPRRLFQRYVIGNPLFMIRCLRWKS